MLFTIYDLQSRFTNDSRFTNVKSQHKTRERKSPRSIGVAGAFSIGIGGIIGGGIFATLGLAGSQARGATFLPFVVGGLVALLTPIPTSGSP